ncbi:MAG: porphobilinogen synthase [Candidatus Marinimicrobia bacterium]|nr:porphobilinogen synthase [Candidatus Neomarinimicrobiota bacterium]
MKNNIDLKVRPRRLRNSKILRSLVSETKLDLDDLVYPLFIKSGKKIKIEIDSMPGIYQFSKDTVLNEIEELLKLKINKFILFGIPKEKDDYGSDSFADDGVIQTALRDIKKRFPDVFLITDVCFCEFTSHGHCGITKNNSLDNDTTIEYLQKQVVSHAKAGADMVAPSGMVDGSVKYIRKALDTNGFSSLPILSYSVKFASSFYSPFRDAAESMPKYGNRKKYQMDFKNSRETIKEVQLDISEGADIVMVKPAMVYLDIIKNIKKIVNVPIAAYNVSGEYSMVKAAAKMGWINEDKIMNEILFSIKRAGADIIITYFAKDFAKTKLNEN